MQVILSRDDFELLSAACDHLHGLIRVLRDGSRQRGSRIVQELRVLARTADKPAADVARRLIGTVRNADIIGIEVSDGAQASTLISPTDSV